MTLLCAVRVHCHFYIRYICVKVNNTIVWVSNRLCNGHVHHRIAQQPEYVQWTFTVALTFNMSVLRSTSPLLWHMNYLFKGHSHCHLVV
jgi:hypothetical protein